MRIFGISLLLLIMSRLSYAAEPLTVDILNNLPKLHDVKVSPNGIWLAYGVKNPKSDNNHLYIRPLNGAPDTDPLATAPSTTHSSAVGAPSPSGLAPKQITNHAMGESQVAWGKNSQYLYFVSSRSGSPQLWRIAISGGEAQQVSDLPLPVEGFKLSPDNQQVLLALTIYPDCTTLSCSAEGGPKKAQQGETSATSSVTRYTQLPVRHWDQWLTSQRRHLFIADITDKGTLGPSTDLMPQWDTDVPARPFSGMEEVAFHPDGQSIVFSAKAPSKTQAQQTNFDLFQIQLADRSRSNLTADAEGWESHPVFSDDGYTLAYFSMPTAAYESDRKRIFLRNLRTGAIREPAPLWDRSPQELLFGPNNRNLYVTAQDVGQRSIFQINIQFGDVKKRFSDGYVGDLQRTQDYFVFTRHTLDMPKEAYRLGFDGEDLQPLTRVNQASLSQIQLGETRQFSFSGWNNERVYGYWVKPWNFKEGQRYPIAFLVHGGPQGSFGNMFHTRWNAQLWAAQGYGVVMIDFHGSIGYGQKFTDSIARDWGGKPLEDLQKGLEYITKTEPWLDRNNACALGASYGGYMMNWIAGKWPSAFKCLVNHAGIFDLPSFYYTTEELWFPEHDLGGPAFAGSTDYQAFNPSALVTQWQTPMLVTQGLKDYRVPYGQSLAAFTTLQRRGIDSELLVYPEENHWIQRPENLVDWYQNVFRWMQRYLRQ